MRKIIGIGLVSAFIIASCQKKEETKQENVSQNQSTVQTTQPVVEPNQQNQVQQSNPQQKEENVNQQVKAASTDGKSIFVSKGCTACHQENTDSVGPSLKKIALAYSSDKAKLVAFLKGEGKAIVDPAKEAIMKPQIETTKKLSKEELDALVDFILKH